MRYLLLMYDEPGAYDAVSQTERRALLGEYADLSAELVTAGAFVDANPLQAATGARTVRVENGAAVVAEGPAVQEPTLGGYYLVDVDSIDEAVSWAARVPAARSGRSRCVQFARHSGPETAAARLHPCSPL